LPREGCYFCLDTKVTKKSSQQKGFFAARAFALQNGQNRGWDYFALAHIAPTAKTPYALQPHRPPSFWPFSPEAALLTGREHESFRRHAEGYTIFRYPFC